MRTSGALHRARVELQKQGQDVSFIDTALSVPSGATQCSPHRSGALFARGSAADLEALRNESESQMSIDRSRSANGLKPELHYVSKQGAEVDGLAVHQPRLNSEALPAKGIPSRELMPPPTRGEDGEKTQNRPSGSGILLQQSSRKPSNRLISSNLDTLSKGTVNHGESYSRTYDRSSQLPSQSAAADAVTAFHLPLGSRNNSDNSLQTLLAQYEYPNTPVSRGLRVNVADSMSAIKDQPSSNTHRTGTDTSNTKYDLQNQPPNSGHLWPSIRQESKIAENRSIGPAYASHKYNDGNVDEQAQVRRRAPPVPNRLTFPPSTPSVTLRGTPLTSTTKRDSASRAHSILANRRSQRRQQQKALNTSTVRASPYFRSATLPSSTIPHHSKGSLRQTSLFSHKPSDHSRPTSISPFPISSPSFPLDMRGACSATAQPQQRTAAGPVRGHGMRAGHDRREYNPPSINSFPFTASPRLIQSKTPIGGVRGLYPNSTPRRPANR
ncbi:MAG: hypothetical protein Q9214_005504 [Letrouitia sp. 1 TL-2023]